MLINQRTIAFLVTFTSLTFQPLRFFVQIAAGVSYNLWSPKVQEMTIIPIILPALLATFRSQFLDFWLNYKEISRQSVAKHVF